ncbi:sodium/potassium/calcium exchanger 1-like [Centropristis striata]|uniref:sodium/potassium/calcium exchanger 1-like n=1 Tax=Centropristis striata TaxID=184440 RepID=UPI0027E041F2|nr:sodium/potassium/calcium exchanger 1-like [Centropristis striata]XP_059191963.1 sodium/potassium/calcium exchanger 1-like [Centropristis striata]
MVPSVAKMNSTKRKGLQLRRVLFLLSGVFLCTFYQLTINARLYEPQTGEDFGETSIDRVEEATAETQVLEELLIATNKFEPIDQTPWIQAPHNSDVTSDFKLSRSTESPPSNLTYVLSINVASEPPQETHTPASPAGAPHTRKQYPKDLFSIEDRRRGWVILHIFGMMYMFIALAIVCDEFFVPALGVITDKLAISDDVAGATFMAAGSSAPKLFAFLIGVFTTHSHVGIGTIVGSAVYNIVFVIGMCALFSREVLHITWWPLFRDVSFYILGLIFLIIFFLDNVIMWWESMMLVACYTLYMIFMKFNVQVERTFKTLVLKNENNIRVIAVEEPEKDNKPAGEEGSGVSVDTESDEDSDDSRKNKNGKQNEEEEEEKDEPLSLQWPSTPCKQATYLFLLPIIFPLWITVPDVRNQKSRKFFVITFLGSILWIAVFFYFMVWWAQQVDETIGIPHQIITILAAGMAAPDLITSVIVARKGLGDMAVSSSVGSNIFDITVGLPVPWLLYSSFHGFGPVAVSNNGLLCAIVLLFIIHFFFIISIASCKKKLNKKLGVTMCLLYFIFVVLSLMLQYRIIVCPVSVGART